MLLHMHNAGVYDERLHTIPGFKSGLLFPNLSPMALLKKRAGAQENSQAEQSTPRAERLHKQYATNITQLRLSGSQIGHLAADVLISVLGQCTRLEIFSLSKLDIAVPRDHIRGPVVQLSHIKIIELDGISREAVVFILDSVHIPRKAPLFSPSQARRTQSPDYETPSLQIDARRVTLCDATPDVNLSLSDNSKPNGSSSSIIGRLYSAVDFSLVTKLQYQDEYTEHSAPAVYAWKALLASMPSLTTLELGAPKQPDVMQSIIVALTPDEELPIDRHMCQQLKHLRINLSGPQGAHASATFIYCLLRCLRTRRLSGCANLNISMVLPSAEESWNDTLVERLKALADDVCVRNAGKIGKTRHILPHRN